MKSVLQQWVSPFLYKMYRAGFDSVVVCSSPLRWASAASRGYRHPLMVQYPMNLCEIPNLELYIARLSNKQLSNCFHGWRGHIQFSLSLLRAAPFRHFVITDDGALCRYFRSYFSRLSTLWMNTERSKIRQRMKRAIQFLYLSICTYRHSVICVCVSPFPASLNFISRTTTVSFDLGARPNGFFSEHSNTGTKLLSNINHYLFISVN